MMQIVLEQIVKRVEYKTMGDHQTLCLLKCKDGTEIVANSEHPERDEHKDQAEQQAYFNALSKMASMLGFFEEEGKLTLKKTEEE